MTFPAEAVPDGYVLAPHHLYVGLFVLWFAVWVVVDDYGQREPLLAVAGAAFALFGFPSVWQFYHGTGAAMVLAGVTLALVGVCWPGGMWAPYPLHWRVLALLGVCIALDDAVSHALGWWTPLDAFWKVGVYQALP